MTQSYGPYDSKQRAMKANRAGLLYTMADGALMVSTSCRALYAAGDSGWVAEVTLRDATAEEKRAIEIADATKAKNDAMMMINHHGGWSGTDEVTLSYIAAYRAAESKIRDAESCTK